MSGLSALLSLIPYKPYIIAFVLCLLLALSAINSKYSRFVNLLFKNVVRAYRALCGILFRAFNSLVDIVRVNAVRGLYLVALLLIGWFTAISIYNFVIEYLQEDKIKY